MLRPLLNFFLQSTCPLCDRPTPQPLCQYCQRQLQETQFSPPRCTPQQMVAWGRYGGALKRTIAACKYQNHPELATYLGDLLGIAWLECHSTHGSMLAMPIPLHPDKQRTRGFNQAELIARSFCQRTRLRLDLSLQRGKSTQAQFQLSPQDRQLNLQDAFYLKPGHRLSGRSILLIDDIYTTGATMATASQLLESAGAKIAGIAVAALAVID